MVVHTGMISNRLFQLDDSLQLSKIAGQPLPEAELRVSLQQSWLIAAFCDAT
jgi:hypothetical protein